MIEYRRGGKVLDLLYPDPGKWSAVVGEVEVCEVDADDGVFDIWARLCALDVAHLLPDDCDPVVRRWLETGDEGRRKAARDAAWDAESVAHDLVMAASRSAVGFSWDSWDSWVATARAAGLSSRQAQAEWEAARAPIELAARAANAADAAFYAADLSSRTTSYDEDGLEVECAEAKSFWAARAAEAARAASAAEWRPREERQQGHLHRLIWTAHGTTLTTRERIELSRDLRYRGEDEAAAAVLPPELKEVSR